MDKFDLKKYLAEGKLLKEELFDSSKKKIINWLDQNATKNTDRDIDYDYELEGGEQVKIANGGIMVDIESGISKKLSFSEFKKYFINENEFLNEGSTEEKIFKFAGNEFTGYIDDLRGGFSLFVAFGDSRTLKNNKIIGKELVKTYNKLTDNKRPEDDFSYDLDYDFVSIGGLSNPEINKLEAYFKKIKSK